MTCHDVRELFSALLDETLTREERADVYGHLATCAECRRELTAIERTIALVRGASPVRAPAGFVDRVVKATHPTPWYTRAARALLLPWPVKLPIAATVVVIVAGLSVLMFRGSQEQQQASRYEATPPLADRRVTEAPPPEKPAVPQGPQSSPPAAPAEAPATPPSDATSSDRRDEAREQDRSAAVASRVEQADKRAETEKRDAAPTELGSNRAPAPASPPAPPAATETLAKREATRAKATAAPQVIARLAASDRDTAERALAALATQLGGAVAARRIQADTSVIDLTIPRERYSDFTREAARLGVLRIESEPPDGSDVVRIAVHLAS